MKITDSMVERAAKALAEQRAKHTGPLVFDETDRKRFAKFLIPQCMDPARRILEAALNPPEENKRDGEHG